MSSLSYQSAAHERRGLYHIVRICKAITCIMNRSRKGNYAESAINQVQYESRTRHHVCTSWEEPWRHVHEQVFVRLEVPVQHTTSLPHPCRAGTSWCTCTTSPGHQPPDQTPLAHSTKHPACKTWKMNNQPFTVLPVIFLWFLRWPHMNFQTPEVSCTWRRGRGGARHAGPAIASTPARPGRGVEVWDRTYWLRHSLCRR